jgi:MoxR-like ATPase
VQDSDTSRSHEQCADQVRAVSESLGQVIRGKDDRLQLVTLAVLAGGHVLIEDIPGVGKTTLARTMARAVAGSFSRIQFTPDLLPTDITGVNVFRPDDGSFSFKPGPIFANFVLADEINRASPRTQSALLEAMSEGQVTMDGTSHHLPQPFTVLATQNPVEYHGTYPLPEAQLDRFMVQLDLGYPPEDDERNLVRNRTREDPVAQLAPAITTDELEQLRATVDTVKLAPPVADYLFDIVSRTRRHPQLRIGVSPRGALLYARIVRARSLSQGRGYALPEDVKVLAVPVLAHRVLLDTKAKYEGVERSTTIGEIVEATQVPR